MSQLTVFKENQSYANYNGGLDVSKYNLYVPLTLNKKYIYICDDPYVPRFSCQVVTRSTKVMSGVHTALSLNKTQWRAPKRSRYLQ